MVREVQEWAEGGVGMHAVACGNLVQEELNPTNRDSTTPMEVLDSIIEFPTYMHIQLVRRSMLDVTRSFRIRQNATSAHSLASQQAYKTQALQGWSHFDVSLSKGRIYAGEVCNQQLGWAPNCCLLCREGS